MVRPAVPMQATLGATPLHARALHVVLQLIAAQHLGVSAGRRLDHLALTHQRDSSRLTPLDEVDTQRDRLLQSLLDVFCRELTGHGSQPLVNRGNDMRLSMPALVQPEVCGSLEFRVSNGIVCVVALR